MIPPAVLVIPLFALYQRPLLGTGFVLLNSRTGLILAYTGLNLSFTIWLLRGFVAEIPVELEEAALIDGCGYWTIFFRIVLPLIMPGVVAAAIFTFRTAWNEFLLALVLTNVETRTLPAATTIYLTDFGIQWGRITAMGTIISIPAFVFTFLVSRSLIKGLTAGAIKY